MLHRRVLLIFLFWLIAFPWPFPLSAHEEWIKPSSEDKCPVCGMFVAKYPDWIGGIIFKDGSAVFFDGTKDLMKYYFALDKYDAAGRKTEDIKHIYVTEYYNVTFIDAREAHYVIGSDVYGPMGRELIPFKEDAEANEFMKDHKGKGVIGFDRITRKVIESLD